MSTTHSLSTHLNSLSQLHECGVTRIVAAIGVFDAVHIGHQQILGRLLQLAQEKKAVPVVITFSPHPRSVLTDWDPKLLCTESHRLNILTAFGAVYTVMLPFTMAFAALSAEDFVRHCIHVPGITVEAIVVGRLWHFGQGASGDVTLLERMAEAHHFTVEAVPEVIVDEEIVSTTRIRHAVTEGNIDLAETMLNRPFSLRGIVTAGFGIAAVELETPTANLQPDTNVLPQNGVYAALAVWKGEIYNAVASVGIAPTFHYGMIEPRVEVHFIGEENIQLIEERIEVFFIHYLRGEMEFETPEDLKMQITEDILDASEELRNYRESCPGLAAVRKFICPDSHGEDTV